MTISSYDDNKLISVFNDTNEGVYRSFAVLTVQRNGKQTTLLYAILLSYFCILFRNYLWQIYILTNISETLTAEQDLKSKEIQSTASCQKKGWTVNFKSLHWDKFIITPDGFVAHDCSGKCMNSHSDLINHVKLLRIFNKRPSCCIPVEYLPLPIMFYDKWRNVVIKNYENMIVSKCGCR